MRRPQRRRALRQVDHLAEGPERQLSPTVAVAHVRILDASTSPPPAHGPEPVRPDIAVDVVDGGDPRSLRPVPIDQPFTRPTARHARAEDVVA